MITVTDSGKAEIGSLKIDFYGASRGKVFFNVRDTSKFRYENGYETKGIS